MSLTEILALTLRRLRQGPCACNQSGGTKFAGLEIAASLHRAVLIEDI